MKFSTIGVISAAYTRETPASSFQLAHDVRTHGRSDVRFWFFLHQVERSIKVRTVTSIPRGAGISNNGKTNGCTSGEVQKKTKHCCLSGITRFPTRSGTRRLLQMDSSDLSSGSEERMLLTNLDIASLKSLWILLICVNYRLIVSGIVGFHNQNLLFRLSILSLDFYRPFPVSKAKTTSAFANRDASLLSKLVTCIGCPACITAFM